MNSRTLFTFLVVAFVCLALAPNYFAQVSSGSVFIFRPAAAGGKVNKPPVYHPQISSPVRKPRHPVSVTPKSQPGKPAEVPVTGQLGVTMWRLRPERSDDTGARLLTQNASSSGSAKMVAEAVKADTVFQKGEKVRLSVETPNSGYLYIIDREIRTDGSFGNPYLIFPTTTTHGGDNAVTAGRVIEVPAQTDDPYYFDITPTEANYAGELLTFLVSPTKIAGLKLTNGPLELPNSMVEKWEVQWGANSTTFELDEKGRPHNYTLEEKEAGIGARLLTQNSPAPQTLISVDASKGKPFLISIPMKVGKQ
jgi:hypothetical protein